MRPAASILACFAWEGGGGGGGRVVDSGMEIFLSPLS